MFKLAQSATFFWPVKVNLPTDGGKIDVQTFDAEFRRVPQTRLQEMQDQVEKGELRDKEVVAEVLAGWRGVTDESGDVPFTPGTLDRLLDVPTVAASIVFAFADAHAGLKRKN